MSALTAVMRHLASCKAIGAPAASLLGRLRRPQLRQRVLDQEFCPEHSQVLRVPMTTVDEYVRAQQIPDVDVLKIDVESQEARVLAGATAVLHLQRPWIFIEVLPGADVQSLEEIRNWAEYASYRMGRNALIGADCIEIDAAGPNQILVPAEAQEELRNVAGGIGLEVDLRRSVAAPVFIS